MKLTACIYGLMILYQIGFAVRPAQAGQNLTPEILCEQISDKWKVPLEYIDVCENAEPIKIVVQDMKVDIEHEYYPIMLYYLPPIDIAKANFEAGDNNHIQSFDSAFGKSVLTVGQIKRTHAHQLSGKLKLLLIDKWSSLSKTLLMNKAELLTVAGNHYEVRLLDIRQIDNYQLAGKSIAEKMFKVSQGADNMNDVTVVQVQISSEAYPELWSLQDIGLEYGEKVIHPFEYSINSGDKESKTIELVFPPIEGTELKLHLKFPEVFSEQVINF